MNIPEELLNRLAAADKVVILTGAGISAESGIATFRDPDGLWAKFNPAELASMDGFLANTELVWSWYRYRVKIVEKSNPNPGHEAIAQMEKIFPNVTLITQNVDRLHQRAGSKNIYELHGNLVENYCIDCKEPFNVKEVENPDNLPQCGKCGGKIRPNVVWFGEMLPYDALKAAEDATIESDVFFSVGTSAEVYPAANLPLIAKQNGAYVVEVNPKATAITPYMDCSIREIAGVALPQILDDYRHYV